MDIEKIGYEDVLSISQELSTIVGNIRDNFDSIKNTCSSLVDGGSWNGPAASNFITKFKSFSKNFEEAYDELQKSINFLTNVVNLYSFNDSKSTTAVGGN